MPLGSILQTTGKTWVRHTVEAGAACPPPCAATRTWSGPQGLYHVPATVLCSQAPSLLYILGLAVPAEGVCPRGQAAGRRPLHFWGARRRLLDTRPGRPDLSDPLWAVQVLGGKTVSGDYGQES